MIEGDGRVLGQCRRHEGQFQKRNDTRAETCIQDAFQPRETIVWPTAPIHENKPDVVAKCSVAAPITHAQFRMGTAHLLLKIAPHNKRRMAGVKTEFPHAPERALVVKVKVEDVGAFGHCGGRTLGLGDLPGQREQRAPGVYDLPGQESAG